MQTLTVQAFHPKALNVTEWAGLLTFLILPPSHLECSKQWHGWQINSLQRARITVAGTAPDFHGIPY